MIYDFINDMGNTQTRDFAFKVTPAAINPAAKRRRGGTRAADMRETSDSRYNVVARTAKEKEKLLSKLYARARGKLSFHRDTTRCKLAPRWNVYQTTALEKNDPRTRQTTGPRHSDEFADAKLPRVL